MQQKRKMAFYEIQKGKLALDMQSAFEEAQKQAFIHQSPAKVTLTIAVYPPANRNENFGQVQFTVSKSLPSTKSMKLTTILTTDGIITDDGTSVTDVLQQELEFNEPTILKLNNENNQ